MLRLALCFDLVVGFTGLKIEHPTRQFERLNEPQVFDLILRFFSSCIFLNLFIFTLLIAKLELEIRGGGG